MSELEKSDLKKLGRRIKRARREMSMTQARLAELIGVEVGHIWRLEKRNEQYEPSYLLATLRSPFHSLNLLPRLTL